MTVNLAWHDATAATATHFTKQERDAGWPPTLTTGQLAALQRPYAYGDSQGRRACRVLHGALIAACVAQAIEHTATTERVQVAPAVRRVIHPGSGGSEWDERGFETRSFLGGTLRTAYTQPAQHRDVTRHRITAPAFAAWLALQGEEPSAHITAWFKAQQIGAHAPVTETTVERDARWLLVWDKASPTHAKGSQARAIESIAAAEGMEPDTVKAGLQRANKARTASQRAAGVVPMKRSKNTANNPFNTVPAKAAARS